MKLSRTLKKLNLKRKIQQKQILKDNPVEYKMEITGEPLIYSIKYSVGERLDHLPHFRNQQWYSMVKCHFNQALKSSSPVILIVTFFVSPPSSHPVSIGAQVAEKTPATHSYEICDYLLSFLEIIHKSLIASYRQIVKIDAQKFYSSRPRTEFKFIPWSHYDKPTNSVCSQS